jgi:hypothetical protein
MKRPTLDTDSGIILLGVGIAVGLAAQSSRFLNPHSQEEPRPEEARIVQGKWCRDSNTPEELPCSLRIPQNLEEVSGAMEDIRKALELDAQKKRPEVRRKYPKNHFSKRFRRKDHRAQH